MQEDILSDVYGEIERKIEFFRDLSVDLKKDKLSRGALLQDVRFKKRELEEKIALGESAKIEYPLSRQYAKDIPSYEKDRIKKETKDAENLLSRAWTESKSKFEFGLSNDQYIEYLGEMVSLINPSIYGIRKENVRIEGGSVMPPETGNILSELFHFFEENGAIQYIPEKAFHAHLNIARIHPFLDGNGRLGRLVQNTILYKGDYPPAIIKEGERHHYYELLRSAMVGNEARRYDDIKGLSDEEKSFYIYLAGKVNLSLDQILNGG